MRVHKRIATSVKATKVGSVISEEQVEGCLALVFLIDHMKLELAMCML